MIIISKNVIPPTMVVKTPIFFDFVHPESPRTMHKNSIPNKNDIEPIVFGIDKFMDKILLGYPLVVIITIFVIANTDTRKHPAANVVVLKI